MPAVKRKRRHRSLPCPRKHPKGMAAKGAQSLASAEIQWVAYERHSLASRWDALVCGYGPVVSLALDHRLVHFDASRI